MQKWSEHCLALANHAGGRSTCRKVQYQYCFIVTPEYDQEHRTWESGCDFLSQIWTSDGMTTKINIQSVTVRPCRLLQQVVFKFLLMNYILILICFQSVYVSLSLFSNKHFSIVQQIFIVDYNFMLFSLLFCNHHWLIRMAVGCVFTNLWKRKLNLGTNQCNFLPLFVWLYCQTI